MITRPRLKICGVTNIDDARLVGASGADYCGVLVDVGMSERSLSLSEAKKVASASAIPVVILLCDPGAATAAKVVREIRPYAVQLICREAPAFVKGLKSRLRCRVWKTVHLPSVAGQGSPGEYVEAGADALVIDSVDESGGSLRLGGTGKVGDWKAAREIIESVSIPVFLAGGLDADNVGRAIVEVHPYGVDLCSGVEASKGRKDPEKVRALMNSFIAAIAGLRKGRT